MNNGKLTRKGWLDSSNPPPHYLQPGSSSLTAIAIVDHDHGQRPQTRRGLTGSFTIKFTSNLIETKKQRR